MRFHSVPTVLDDAQTLLEYQQMVEEYISRLAQELLSNPQINVALVGEELRPATLNPDEPLNEAIRRLASQGLKLFDLGSDATKTFTVPTDRAEGFLRALLSATARERARLDFLASKRSILSGATEASGDASEENEQWSDTPRTGGIFDSGWSEDASLEVGDEVRLHSFDRAQSLFNELKDILSSRSPENSAWQKSVRSFAKRGANLLDEAFQPDDNDAGALTVAISESTNAAFDTFAPSVTVEGRLAYTGIITTLAGLARGSNDPKAARERVRKAIWRATERPEP